MQYQPVYEKCLWTEWKRSFRKTLLRSRPPPFSRYTRTIWDRFSILQHRDVLLWYCNANEKSLLFPRTLLLYEWCSGVLRRRDFRIVWGFFVPTQVSAENSNAKKLVYFLIRQIYRYIILLSCNIKYVICVIKVWKNVAKETIFKANNPFRFALINYRYLIGVY